MRVSDQASVGMVGFEMYLEFLGLLLVLVWLYNAWPVIKTDLSGTFEHIISSI